MPDNCKQILDGERLRLSRGGARLVLPACALLAGLDQMEAAFCIETLEDALAKHGRPEIFNTDQGSQFTGEAFTSVLAKNGIAIGMDGKGAWRDNVFVERLWRTVKYEEVYLHAYGSVPEARASIGRYLDFYNRRRPHSSLDGMTPAQAYYGAHNLPPVRLAAQPRQTFHLSKRKFCPNNRGHLSAPMASLGPCLKVNANFANRMQNGKRVRPEAKCEGKQVCRVCQKE